MDRLGSRKPVLQRRRFLGTAAALAAPLVLPSRAWGASSPSRRLRIAQLGCGRIAQVHDMPGVLESKHADIVAVCDVDAKRAADGRAWVETFYQKTQRGAPPPVSVKASCRAPSCWETRQGQRAPPVFSCRAMSSSRRDRSPGRPPHF